MKKNILLLVPSLAVGGQERVAVNTSEILADKYQVTMAVFDYKDCKFKPKCEVIDIAIPPLAGKINKFINVIKRSIMIRKIKKQLKIDVTFSFGSTANLVNILSRGKDRAIVSVRGYNEMKKIRNTKLIYNKADKICCVSYKMAVDLIDINNISKDKVTVLYNPYDTGKIKEQAQGGIGQEISYPTIVSVGRLTSVKGYRHLLKAVKVALKDIAELKLLLLGDGELREELIEYTKELGIEKHVIFAGYQSNPYSYVDKCNLYVLSSINEGFPNALVEAMACGVPVISTDCKTGPREILVKEFENKVAEDIEYADYGVLVPPFSSHDSDEDKKDQLLAQAIVNILSSKECYKHYQTKSVERAKDFSNERYREAFINIIDSLD